MSGILIITRELELSDTKAISQSVFEKWEIQSRKKMPGNLSQGKKSAFNEKAVCTIAGRKTPPFYRFNLSSNKIISTHTHTESLPITYLNCEQSRNIYTRMSKNKAQNDCLNNVSCQNEIWQNELGLFSSGRATLSPKSVQHSES